MWWRHEKDIFYQSSVARSLELSAAEDNAHCGKDGTAQEEDAVQWFFKVAQQKTAHHKCQQYHPGNLPASIGVVHQQVDLDAVERTLAHKNCSVKCICALWYSKTCFFLIHSGLLEHSQQNASFVNAEQCTCDADHQHYKARWGQWCQLDFIALVTSDRAVLRIPKVHTSLCRSVLQFFLWHTAQVMSPPDFKLFRSVTRVHVGYWEARTIVLLIPWRNERP